MTSPARAIADVATGTILASVDIMVPPERVFAALSDGNEITRWWGAPDVYTTDSWTTDFRVGGRWRADGKGADGKPFFVEGEFIEIDRPWKIVQTWEPGWTPGLRTTITYSLSAIEGGTRLVVRQEGFGERRESCEGHANGWIRVLGWLAADIGPKPGPDPHKYFIAKLIGPRPDFARTLSADEMTMMLAHVRYWTPLMEQGKVLALGPVNDPNWTYGIGVMRVDSEEELLELQRHDPAITMANGATHYENAPMFRIAYKQ